MTLTISKRPYFMIQERALPLQHRCYDTPVVVTITNHLSPTNHEPHHSFITAYHHPLLTTHYSPLHPPLTTIYHPNLAGTSITSIGNDDSSLTTVDFTGDSIFQMKSDVKTQDLCTALRNNHFVTTLKLKNCEVRICGRVCTRLLAIVRLCAHSPPPTINVARSPFLFDRWLPD